MRFFYRDGAIIYERIELEKESHTLPVEEEVANTSVSDGTGQLFDNQRDLMTASRYKADRRMEFPSIAEQLDKMYHDAVDGTTTWQEAVQAVKDADPKPE